MSGEGGTEYCSRIHREQGLISQDRRRPCCRVPRHWQFRPRSPRRRPSEADDNSINHVMEFAMWLFYLTMISYRNSRVFPLPLWYIFINIYPCERWSSNEQTRKNIHERAELGSSASQRISLRMRRSVRSEVGGQLGDSLILYAELCFGIENGAPGQKVVRWQQLEAFTRLLLIETLDEVVGRTHGRLRAEMQSKMWFSGFQSSLRDSAKTVPR